MLRLSATVVFWLVPTAFGFAPLHPPRYAAVPHSAHFATAPPTLTAAAAPPRSAHVVAAALPTLPVIAAACAVPTCLGYWKTEYGVSYAYGFATALMGALVLRAGPPTAVATMHAAALVAYGTRLNAFLLWRELSVARFREFREKIEARTVAAGGRLKRTPFILSCALLYACMAAPILVSARAVAPGLATAALVAAAWAGLLLAAIGDLTKSWVKARRGPDALVTSGVFRLFRHPNYTGEQILWTANLLAGFAAAASGGAAARRASLGWLGASVVGWAGIMFVLAQATANLEKKQEERMIGEFERWKKGSWGGVSLAK